VLVDDRRRDRHHAQGKCFRLRALEARPPTVSGDGERLALSAFEAGVSKVKVFDGRTGRLLASEPSDLERFVYSEDHQVLLGRRSCELGILDGTSAVMASRFGIRGRCASPYRYGFTKTRAVMVVRDDNLEVWDARSKSLTAFVHLTTFNSSRGSPREIAEYLLDAQTVPALDPPTDRVAYY
jgi:hypothetical protein